MRRIGYITGLLAILASFTFAQVLPDNAQQEAWQHFNQQHSGKVFIRWHEETGTPATIHGFKSKIYDNLNSPEEIARQFLIDNRVIFKMDAELADLVLLRHFEDNGVHHIDFRETFEGIPVYGGEYSVAVSSDKTIHMAGGRYYPDITPPAEVAISEEEAIDRALAFFNMEKSVLREQSSELVIVPGDAPYFAYRLGLNQWEAVVNAGTGKVEIYFERIMRIDGIGRVYPKDPVNSSITTVPIPQLWGAGTKLEGTYVKVTNNETGDAYSASSDFRYTPPSYTQHDGTHFDDANVYYHVDKYAAVYWPAVGFSGLGQQVLASVHDLYPYGHDNAAANWGTMRLYFGHGISIFWDFAKKDDVIYHEYTHLVSGYIGLGGGGEQSMMHEGYSDYHAASFTSDPQIGEWVTRNYPNLRITNTAPNVYNYNDIDNLPTYPPNSTGSNHHKSMIWSGVLWDLRGELGSSTTDFLVYKGLVYQHASGTTFINGREGVIAADQNYYSGAHVATIMDVFAARGIGDPYTLPDPPPAAPTGLIIANAGQVGRRVRLSWDANTEPDLDHYNVWRECQYGVYAVNCNLHVIGSTTSTSYTDGEVFIDINDGSTDLFTYYVTAVDAADQESGYSNSAFTWGSSFEKSITAEPVPDTYALQPAHPNPFNPSTRLNYDLPEASRVSLVIYDVMGREVRSWSATEELGFKSRLWDGRNNKGQPVAGGVYIYRMTATSVESGEIFSAGRKMVFLK